MAQKKMIFPGVQGNSCYNYLLSINIVNGKRETVYRAAEENSLLFHRSDKKKLAMNIITLKEQNVISVVNSLICFSSKII